jgi:small subunit ribosomal protein S6
MKKERRHLYEGMYILSATLSEEARNKALDKITNGITERGGEVHKTHEQGRRRFAYTIGKKRDGYYYVIYFTVATNYITELWEDYHLHEDLLRYITLRTDKIMEELEFKPINIT